MMKPVSTVNETHIEEEKGQIDIFQSLKATGRNFAIASLLGTVALNGIGVVGNVFRRLRGEEEQKEKKLGERDAISSSEIELKVVSPLYDKVRRGEIPALSDVLFPAHAVLTDQGIELVKVQQTEPFSRSPQFEKGNDDLFIGADASQKIQKVCSDLNQVIGEKYSLQVFTVTPFAKDSLERELRHQHDSQRPISVRNPEDVTLRVVGYASFEGDKPDSSRVGVIDPRNILTAERRARGLKDELVKVISNTYDLSLPDAEKRVEVGAVEIQPTYEQYGSLEDLADRKLMRGFYPSERIHNLLRAYNRGNLTDLSSEEKDLLSKAIDENRSAKIYAYVDLPFEDVAGFSLVLIPAIGIRRKCESKGDVERLKPHLEEIDTHLLKNWGRNTTLDYPALAEEHRIALKNDPKHRREAVQKLRDTILDHWREAREKGVEILEIDGVSEKMAASFVAFRICQIAEMTKERTKGPLSNKNKEAYGILRRTSDKTALKTEDRRVGRSEMPDKERELYDQELLRHPQLEVFLSHYQSFEHQSLLPRELKPFAFEGILLKEYFPAQDGKEACENEDLCRKAAAYAQKLDKLSKAQFR